MTAVLASPVETRLRIGAFCGPGRELVEARVPRERRVHPADGTLSGLGPTFAAHRRKGLSLLLLLVALGLAVPATVALALVWLQSQAADRLVHAQEGKLLARDAAQLAERLRAFVEPSEQDLAFVAGLARAD